MKHDTGWHEKEQRAVFTRQVQLSDGDVVFCCINETQAGGYEVRADYGGNEFRGPLLRFYSRDLAKAQRAVEAFFEAADS